MSLQQRVNVEIEVTGFSIDIDDDDGDTIQYEIQTRVPGRPPQRHTSRRPIALSQKERSMIESVMNNRWFSIGETSETETGD